MSGLCDKYLYLLGHLNEAKIIFEDGIRKVGDWKFPIFLCPISNKHHMPTKWLQTIGNGTGISGFASEKRVERVFVYSISSLVGSSLDTERVLSEGLPQEHFYYRCPSHHWEYGATNKLLRDHVPVPSQRMSSRRTPHLGHSAAASTVPEEYDCYLPLSGS